MAFSLKLKTIFVLLTAFSGALSLKFSCHCQDAKDCRPLKVKKNNKYEVYAFTNGATDIKSWKWDTITTVVAPSSFISSGNFTHLDTKCTTHHHGKKFGLTVDMDLSGPLNASSSETEIWIADVIRYQQVWGADLVNLDLLSYFKSDHESSKNDHVQLAQIINKMHKSLDKANKHGNVTVEVSCVVPWKPPCSSTEASCVFSSVMTGVCDFFVISPESFLDTDDEKCRASATVPFSKLVYGISEYNAHQVPSNVIILGVTWHGYDYTCLDYTNDVCKVASPQIANSTVTKCDFSKRKRITYGDLTSDYSEQVWNHKTNYLYNAPFFHYKDGSVDHQVWFEDHSSLISKYRLVKELSLAGLGIMYGDDLAPTNKLLSDDGLLWSWVAHEFLLSTTQSDMRASLHCADTVAGVAVGCLLLGCVLGIAFTCLSFHKRIRKPRPTFLRPSNTEADEYTDEDHSL